MTAMFAMKKRTLQYEHSSDFTSCKLFGNIRQQDKNNSKERALWGSTPSKTKINKAAIKKIRSPTQNKMAALLIVFLR